MERHRARPSITAANIYPALDDVLGPKLSASQAVGAKRTRDQGPPDEMPGVDRVSLGC